MINKPVEACIEYNSTRKKWEVYKIGEDGNQIGESQFLEDFGEAIRCFSRICAGKE